MARIALFGGSFDPPHLGHVLAACTARLRGLDAVWVLPAARHPYGKALSPWAQRLDLCHAAFDGLGDWCVVKTDELDNPSGFTFDLVTLLSARHPEHSWHLVGGTDTATDMPRWHRGQELLKLVEICAIPRRGWDDQHPAALPAISSSDLRRRILAREPWAELVPTKVADRITAASWYGHG